MVTLIYTNLRPICIDLHQFTCGFDQILIKNVKNHKYMSQTPSAPQVSPTDRANLLQYLKAASCWILASSTPPPQGVWHGVGEVSIWGKDKTNGCLEIFSCLEIPIHPLSPKGRDHYPMQRTQPRALTHVHDTGLLLPHWPAQVAGDSATFISHQRFAPTMPFGMFLLKSSEWDGVTEIM